MMGKQLFLGDKAREQLILVEKLQQANESQSHQLSKAESEIRFQKHLIDLENELIHNAKKQSNKTHQPYQDPLPSINPSKSQDLKYIPTISMKQRDSHL
jgi:hypothetical protein